MTTCPVGSEEGTAPTPSSDRSCQQCVLGVTYQDEFASRSCKAVSECPKGYSERTAPTLFQDRLCDPPVKAASFLATTTGTGVVAGAAAGCVLLLLLIVVVVLRRRRGHRGGANLNLAPGKPVASSFLNPMYDSGPPAAALPDGGMYSEDMDDGGYEAFEAPGGGDEPGYLDISVVPDGPGAGLGEAEEEEEEDEFDA